MNSSKKKICFILLPGFSVDDQDVLELKKILEDKGYNAIATNFYGDIEIKDFSSLTFDTCFNNISKIINKAINEHDKVFGIGISLGGSILLEYAKNYKNLHGIVSLGTPFRLKHKNLISLARCLFPFYYPVWKYLQRIKKLRLSPLGSGIMVVDFLENSALKNLDRVTTPVLFLHSKKDRVADYKALAEYIPKLYSIKKDFIFFENGNHVINYDPKLISEYAINFFGLEQTCDDKIISSAQGC